jgi:hypothetical protein
MARLRHFLALPVGLATSSPRKLSISGPKGRQGDLIFTAEGACGLLACLIRHLNVRPRKRDRASGEPPAPMRADWLANDVHGAAINDVACTVQAGPPPCC